MPLAKCERVADELVPRGLVASLATPQQTPAP